MMTDSILQVLLTSDQLTLTRCHAPNARAAMEASTEKRLQAGIGQSTAGFFWSFQMSQTMRPGVGIVSTGFHLITWQLVVKLPLPTTPRYHWNFDHHLFRGSQNMVGHAQHLILYRTKSPRRSRHTSTNHAARRARVPMSVGLIMAG